MLWPEEGQGGVEPPAKLMQFLTWLSVGWAQKRSGVVEGHGGLDHQCKT